MTGEVLPLIRKTGRYQVLAKPTSSPETAKPGCPSVPTWADHLGAMGGLTNAVAALLDRRPTNLVEVPEISQATWEIFDEILSASKFTTLDEVARILGLEKRGFYEFLRENGILHNGSEWNSPSRASLESGLLSLQVDCRRSPNGNPRKSKRTVVSPSGLLYMVESLCLGRFDGFRYRE